LASKTVNIVTPKDLQIGAIQSKLSRAKVCYSDGGRTGPERVSLRARLCLLRVIRVVTWNVIGAAILFPAAFNFSSTVSRMESLIHPDNQPCDSSRLSTRSRSYELIVVFFSILFFEVLRDGRKSRRGRRTKRMLPAGANRAFLRTNFSTFCDDSLLG
jgi:hypothetical protein